MVLGALQSSTGVNGVATFLDLVSIEDPGHGGDDPAEIIDWHPSRILAGNLRGVPEEPIEGATQRWPLLVYTRGARR